MIEDNNFFEEENEIPSLPTDITDSLDNDIQAIYNEMKIRLISANLEYIIENSSKLIERNTKNNYILFGTFLYYSPRNISYDFLEKPPNIKIRIDENPAMIMYKKVPVLFYLPHELIAQMPEIVYKSHSRTSKNSLTPTKITNPIFSLNLDPQSNQLIQLNLVSVDEISLLEETRFFPKYHFMDEDYQILGVNNSK